MSYGQAVRFEAKFSYLLPPEKDVIISVKKDSQPPLKPTLGQLSFLDPAVKCFYLSK